MSFLHNKNRKQYKKIKHGPHINSKRPEKRVSDRRRRQEEEALLDSGAETATMEEVAAMIKAAEQTSPSKPEPLAVSPPLPACPLCKCLILDGQRTTVITFNSKPVKVHWDCDKKEPVHA